MAATSPWNAATCSGVNPLHCLASMFAFSRTSVRITSTDPGRRHCIVARCSAVAPSSRFASTTAPKVSTSVLTACVRPLAAATISGVMPMSVLASMSAFSCTSVFKTSACPRSAAT